jgi:hypothetical protein
LSPSVGVHGFIIQKLLDRVQNSTLYHEILIQRSS